MLGNGVRQVQVVNAVYLDAPDARNFYTANSSEKPMMMHQKTTDIHSIGRAVLDVFHFVNILPSQANLKIMVYTRHASIEGSSPEKSVTSICSQT